MPKLLSCLLRVAKSVTMRDKNCRSPESYRMKHIIGMKYYMMANLLFYEYVQFEVATMC